jgi:hypothetical protein
MDIALLILQSVFSLELFTVPICALLGVGVFSYFLSILVGGR